MYTVIIVFYLKVELIINGNNMELMIIKQLFEGPVGDYCIARNTIKCLFHIGVTSWGSKIAILKQRLHQPLSLAKQTLAQSAN